VIIKGGSRSNWRFFAKHLVNGKDNERAELVEIHGLAGETVLDALREMDALAGGTRCKNHFYHAAINPREGDRLTPEQWEQAIDLLEKELGLEGHSRFVVEHEKEGRTHRHVIWSRIDTDSMTAVSDSNNYKKHELAGQKIAKELNLEAVEPCLTRDTDKKRQKRNPDNWEEFRGRKSGIKPKTVKEEVSKLWKEAENGIEFKQFLEDNGYILCKGDKRDFCIIDAAGNEHSLARRIDGAKAKEIREFMEGVDKDSLPSVAEGRELVKNKPAGNSSNAIEHEPEEPVAGNRDNAGLDNQPVEAEKQEEQQKSKVDEALEPYRKQLQDNGHININIPPEFEGRNWNERFAGFTSYLSDRLNTFYEKGKATLKETKQSAQSAFKNLGYWVGKIRGAEPENKPDSWTGYIMDHEESRNRDDFDMER